MVAVLTAGKGVTARAGRKEISSCLRRRRQEVHLGLRSTRCRALNPSVASPSQSQQLQVEVPYPPVYDLAFNLGTSLVLVPAYMALSLTRRPKPGTKKGVLDLLWSPSETKMGVKWWLTCLIPMLLGSIFFTLFVLDKALFLDVFKCCWRGQVGIL